MNALSPLVVSELGECVLDLHCTLGGFGLSLVWKDAEEQELRRVFLREYPTLTAAVRARGKALFPSRCCAPSADASRSPLAHNSNERGA